MFSSRWNTSLNYESAVNLYLDNILKYCMSDTYAHISLYMLMCTCATQKTMLGVFLSCSLPYFLRKVSHWTWISPIQWGWLATEPQGSPCLRRLQVLAFYLSARDLNPGPLVCAAGVSLGLNIWIFFDIFALLSGSCFSALNFQNRHSKNHSQAIICRPALWCQEPGKKSHGGLKTLVNQHSQYGRSGEVAAEN